MAQPLQVFCCYARSDQQYLYELKKHLVVLQREGLIEIKADIDISLGTEWEQEINRHLEEAQIILLLISAAFIASDYCYDKEMHQAMERHEQGTARVIPVIIRPTSWENMPFGKLQALPRDAKPVSNWQDEDKAFTDIVLGIRRTIGTSKSWIPSPSTVSLLRSFVRSLVIIPDNTWTKVEVAERAYSSRESLVSPEVIEKILDEIDLLCSNGGRTLSPNWRQEYWTSGFIKAVAQRESKMVLNFLERAEDDLLPIVIELRPFKYINRIHICRMKLYTQEEAEEYFRRCLNAGLLYEGIPKGEPGSYYYIGQMLHQVTPLVSIIGRLLDMSGIQPQVTDGHMESAHLEPAAQTADIPPSIQPSPQKQHRTSVATLLRMMVAVKKRILRKLTSILSRRMIILKRATTRTSTQLKRRHIALVLIPLILVLIGAGSLGIYTATAGRWRTSQGQPTSLTPSTGNQTIGKSVQANATGKMWHVQHSDTSQHLNSVTWSGSQFVAVGGGTILTSPDGRAWTAQNSSALQAIADTTLGLEDLAWSGSQFVAVGAVSTILTSPDGRAWTVQNSGTSQSVNLSGVAWSGSQFVAVGGGTILTSPDGRTWTAQNSGTSQAIDLWGVVWSDSQFVAVGTGGTILTSPDGRAWTTQNSGTSDPLSSVAWSGSQWVAVEEHGTINGTILTSPDGRAWTTQNSGTSQGLVRVAWSGSQFVVVGWYGTILTSPDGHVWTTQNSETSQDLNGVAWSGSQLVVVGIGGTILTSP